MKTEEENHDYRAAVITAYRHNLQKRYSPENLRRLINTVPVSDDLILELRDFFLEHIYPEPERRQFLDRAFDHLGDILRSPRKVWALVGTAGRSFFRFGFMIPQAIAAGVHTLEAYLDVRRQERTILKYSHDHDFTPEAILREENFEYLISRIPRKQIIHFRHEMVALFKSLSNIRLLYLSIEILEDAAEVMKSNSDIYTEEELNGLTLGYGMLKAGVAMFEKLSPEQIEAVYQGVDRVEIDWYENIKATYAEA